MLLFKEQYRTPIEQGRKTLTLRAWKSRRARPDTIRKTNLGFSLWIDSVEEIATADLTDEIAHADGYPSVAAMLEDGRKLYGMIPDMLTLIRFEYLGYESKPAAD